MLIKMICEGRNSMDLRSSAPKYLATMAEIAERVCARIQTIAEIKEPAIPTAARLSVPLTGKFPMMAVSVIESKGSAIPEIIAGMANLFIVLNEGPLLLEIDICTKQPLFHR
jgi:hypothetical protein